MNKIISTQKLENPRFIKLLLINYEQDGELKKWEAVLSHDSVAVLLYNTDKKAFVLEVNPSFGAYLVAIFKKIQFSSFHIPSIKQTITSSKK